jgi:hypothetical protein
LAEQTAQCLATCPEDGRYWQLHGIARWFLGDPLAARRALETASCLRSLTPLAQVALAGAYLQTGKGDVARVIYRYLGECEACSLGLLPKVAVGLGSLGEHGAALEVCWRIVRQDPRHHAAWFGLAFYMGRLGYPLASLLDPLIKAHNLAPQVLSYRLNLALVYGELGWLAQAYFLVKPIAPHDVPRGFCLERFASLFAAVGDEERSRAFRAWLAHGVKEESAGG